MPSQQQQQPYYQHTCPPSSSNGGGQRDGSAASGYYGAEAGHAPLLAEIGGQYRYPASGYADDPTTTAATTSTTQGAYNTGGAYYPSFPSYASPSSMAGFAADADAGVAAAGTASAAAAAHAHAHAHAHAAYDNAVPPGQAYAAPQQQQPQQQQPHHAAAAEVSWRQMMRGNDFHSESARRFSLSMAPFLFFASAVLGRRRILSQYWLVLVPRSVRRAVPLSVRACLLLWSRPPSSATVCSEPRRWEPIRLHIAAALRSRSRYNASSPFYIPSFI
jgi:hypothetical protein